MMGFGKNMSMLRYACAAASIAVVCYAALCRLGPTWRVQDVMEAAINYIEAQGDNALLAYLVFSCCGVVFLFPTTPMEFAGGFLFSSRYGLLTTWFLTSLAKLVANVISVLVARYVLRDWVMQTFVKKSDFLTMVSKAVHQEPFKMAFLVRGSMVPVSVKNYGLGVLEIGLLPIALAACVFGPFYAFQHIYFGSACQNLRDVFALKKTTLERNWMDTVKKVLPIVFNILLVVALIRALKAQIKQAREATEAKLKAVGSSKSD